MFQLGTKIQNPIYGALIDIGAGTVGVAVVASDFSHALPTLIYQERLKARGSTETQDIASIRRIRELLLEATLLLGSNGRAALKEIDPQADITELCITIASPWSYTILETIEHIEAEEFKITESLLTELVTHAEIRILDQVRKEQSTKKQGFEIIERATVGAAVNEYPVENPLRLKGNMLNLTHVAGLIPSKIIESIFEVQDKIFPESRLRMHTSMLAMYSVISNLFPRTHAFCIIDITKEATEFGIVENDTLIENSFIPFGTEVIMTTITAATKRPIADIETALSGYTKKEMVRDADTNNALNVYSAHVATGLEDILSRRTLPDHVVITAHDPFKGVCTDAIIKAIKKTTGNKPDIIAINEHLIQEISHGTGSDIYLALAARFFHKVHTKDRISHS